MPSKAATSVTTFRFDQMATLINDRVDNPAESGVERYVGLEHLDTDSLRIRRWGEITDVESTKLRFQPGDIIFGKRRVYQRKLAVADFEGICSAHAMVLRAKANVVLPEFLPFFMQSDLFMERALAISVGSLSPTINWTTLAAEEFALPPLEEQRRIVRALEAAWKTCEALQRLLAATEEIQAAHRDAALVGPANLNVPRLDDVDLLDDWQLVPARDIAIAPVSSGVTPKEGQANPDTDCRFIKVGDLSFDGRLLYGDSGSRISRQAFDDTRTLHVLDGDVLTNIVGPPLGKVSVVPLGFGTALINQAIVRFRMPSGDMRDWLSAFLMSRWAKQWLFARSKKTSGQRNINARTCGELPIPIPPERVLATQLQMLRSMRESVERARDRLSNAKEMFRTLAAEAFHQ